MFSIAGKPISKPENVFFLPKTIVFVIEKIFFVTKTIVFVIEKIFFVTKTIVFVIEKIFSVAMTIVSVIEKIFSVAKTIVSVVEKIFSVAMTIVFDIEKIFSVAKTIVFDIEKTMIGMVSQGFVHRILELIEQSVANPAGCFWSQPARIILIREVHSQMQLIKYNSTVFVLRIFCQAVFLPDPRPSVFIRGPFDGF